MSGPISLPAQRPGSPPPPELAAQRRQIVEAIAAGVWTTGLAPETVDLAGCEALHFRSVEPARAIVLALHGGGFRLGAPEFNAAFAEALVLQTGVDVVLPRYRLAPEHPFPAGLADAWTCLTELRSGHPDLPLIVCGDSAGGGLAAALAVLDGCDGGARIDGLVLLSPWADVTVTAASFDTNAASDPLFSRESATTAAHLYLQGADAKHPLASPLRAPAVPFPPTLIVVGSGEVLLDDSVQLHAKLMAEGAQARLHIIDGMEHVAVTRGLALPGASECLAHVVEFVTGLVGEDRGRGSGADTAPEHAA